jgi:hypothetical protein
METTALTMFRQTIQYSGQYIWVKPVCEFFEISLQNQHRKIKNDSILGKLWTKKSADLGQIDNNGRILLSRKGFIRWIQIINANTIVERLREKFSIYQELIFDYLYGSAEEEEQAKIDYQLIQKYRRLYAKIGRHLQIIERRFTGYLDTKYVQLKLDFNTDHQLPD